VSTNGNSTKLAPLDGTPMGISFDPVIPTKPKRVRAGRKMKRFEVWELVTWIDAESEESARDRLPETRAFELREWKK